VAEFLPCLTPLSPGVCAVFDTFAKFIADYFYISFFNFFLFTATPWVDRLVKVSRQESVPVPGVAAIIFNIFVDFPLIIRCSLCRGHFWPTMQTSGCLNLKTIERVFNGAEKLLEAW